MIAASALGRRLRGRTIFMSASVPSAERAETFRRIPDAALEIEQAVISLARAVFAEGGRLVFGGHPSISPLVALVAGEYRPALAADGSEAPPPAQLLIFQSDLFRERVPEDTAMMFRIGLAEPAWTARDPAEHFIPGPSTGPRYPRSLERMRREMIESTRPDAMVAIGGMEGVIEEVKLFAELRPGHPIFLLRRTGGAASVLAEKPGEGVEVIDDLIMERMRRTAGDAAAGESGDGTVPYPLIMQTIVDRLAGPDDDED